MVKLNKKMQSVMAAFFCNNILISTRIMIF